MSAPQRPRPRSASARRRSVPARSASGRPGRHDLRRAGEQRAPARRTPVGSRLRGLRARAAVVTSARRGNVSGHRRRDAVCVAPRFDTVEDDVLPFVVRSRTGAMSPTTDQSRAGTMIEPGVAVLEPCVGRRSGPERSRVGWCRDSRGDRADDVTRGRARDRCRKARAVDRLQRDAPLARPAARGRSSRSAKRSQPSLSGGPCAWR